MFEATCETARRLAGRKYSWSGQGSVQCLAGERAIPAPKGPGKHVESSRFRGDWAVNCRCIPPCVLGVAGAAASLDSLPFPPGTFAFTTAHARLRLPPTTHPSPLSIAHFCPAPPSCLYNPPAPWLPHALPGPCSQPPPSSSPSPPFWGLYSLGCVRPRCYATSNLARRWAPRPSSGR